MAFPTPQGPGRWRNSRGVVTSGTSKGATPTKGRIVAGSQTWSSHSRSERPRQTRATCMRGSTRSPTLGLPIAGSASPRPGVSTAGLPREGEPGAPGAGLGGAVGEPGAPGPALPSHAHLGVRECELCHADTPSLDATNLRLYYIRR